jgi:hypothetical protein
MDHPMVIVLDLDATIVGDVSWLALEKGLIQKYNQSTSHKIRYNVAALKNDLKQGLLRPYVADALRSIQKKYATIEYFIYTASEAKWAEFLIPQIETIIGIKFNRPIFTRKHCRLKNGIYCKSFEFIKKAVLKHLTRKYGQISQDPFMIMIDNTERILMESCFQITCPSYNYKLPVDLLRNFPISHIPLFAPHIKTIIGMDEQRSIESRIHFMMYYHKFMHSAYYKARKSNRIYTNDMFWKRFAKAFINMHTSLVNKPAEACKYLAQKLNDRSIES